jgi:TRAP transporter TAXI family solute receptor
MMSTALKAVSAVVAVLVAAGAIAWAVIAHVENSDAESRQRFVSIGTGGPTGVYFIVGQAVCRMVHQGSSEGRSEARRNGLRCSAPSTAGSIYNITNVRGGELDFAVVQSDAQSYAYSGTDLFAGSRFPDLRSVFSVHSEPFQIVVAGDSGIDSWDGLKGRRVSIGNLGSGQRATMEMLMKAHGTRLEDFSAVQEYTSTEQSKALCDGKIDAYVYAAGVPNAGEAMAADGCGARIISLDGDIEKKLVAEHSYFVFTAIPKGTYKTTTKDVITFGVKATFVTSARLSENVVYEVVRAVFDNFDEFRRLHPALERLEPDQMIRDGLTAPLHPGAIRYYKERGWM